VIADLNGHKILAITLDDVMVYIASVDDHENTNDMFHGFPPKAMIKNTELHGIFATAKENEHILVCGHQEKKEDLYPLFSSFLSDSTGILIPRNFERAYRRLSATSTSSLNAWHDYVLSQRKSAELKK
jgi:hypothetical protein